MATVLFVDSNFFLQLKEPESLPWGEIFSKSESVLLMVARAVQTELDRLKQDGNNRRSKRARKASSFLRRVLQSPDATMVIRDAEPRVLIGFPPPHSASATRPTTLDHTRADDQIVAELLEFSASHPSDDAFLFTNDTGPMLTAKHHNLRFIAAPDSWLLDPEPDEREKTIQELRRRLDSLERTHPQIVIVASAQDRQIDRIEEQVSKFEPLSESIIDQLMVEIRRRCPMPNEFRLSSTELSIRQTVAIARGGYLKYTEPTADEIRKYRKDEYPAWLARVRQTLVGAHSSLNQRTQRLKILFRIATSGTVPANNAIVEIRAHGEVSILAPQEDGEAKEPATLVLPIPPTPPLGHVEERGSERPFRLYDPLDAMAPPSRLVLPKTDRWAFYWHVKSLKPTKFLSLTCDEFRHQKEAEKFELGMILPEGKAVSGAVSCRFSAANLPEPVQLMIPVKTVTTIAQTEEYVRSLIQKLPRTIVACADIVDPEP